MTWDPSVFWPAFAAVGVLEEALYHPAAGEPFAVRVGLVMPDALLMGEMVQVTQCEIEYETAAMPALRDGEALDIGTDVYTVRGKPRKKDDGYFSVAEVMKS
jgi:hypothetical protein